MNSVDPVRIVLTVLILAHLPVQDGTAFPVQKVSPLVTKFSISSDSVRTVFLLGISMLAL